MADVIDYKIHGDDMQLVELELIASTVLAEVLVIRKKLNEGDRGDQSPRSPPNSPPKIPPPKPARPLDSSCRR